MIQIYILFCCFTIIMPIFDIGTNHWLFPMGIKTFRRSIKSSFRVLSVTVTLLFGQALHAQHCDAVKITFLSWITGSTKISFEHAFPSIGQSSEIGSVNEHIAMSFTVRVGFCF